MTTEGKRKLGIIVFFALVGSVVGANTEDNSDLIIGTIIAWTITGTVIGWFFASLIVDAHQPWRIASFLPFRRATAKELFTRNQDIVAAHVARVNVAAGMFEAKKSFRRIKAYKQRPILKQALIDHRKKPQLDQIKDAA